METNNRRTYRVSHRTQTWDASPVFTGIKAADEHLSRNGHDGHTVWRKVGNHWAIIFDHSLPRYDQITAEKHWAGVVANELKQDAPAAAGQQA
jgi:hypothetical protein